MATTQETYRLGGRLKRYTTTLNAFKNGMYLTEQTIPEGYARVMVNYDIDDTGSHIKPRQGRLKKQSIPYPENKRVGESCLSDYLYVYDDDKNEVEAIKDIVMSFGDKELVTETNGKVTRFYRSRYTTVEDTNTYVETENGWDVVAQGTITETVNRSSWAIHYDKPSDSFLKINTDELGYITARNVYNAHAFDKQFLYESFTVNDIDLNTQHPDVVYPIFTVANNELYAFTGAPWTDYIYTNNAERNYTTNFDKPFLTKLKISRNASGYFLKREVLEPKGINPIEAATTGFNMLHETPYVFEDKPDAGTVSILGMLAYTSRESGVPLLAATIGNPINIRVYYEYPNVGDSIQYKIEVLDTTNQANIINNNWTVLADFSETDAISAGNEFWFTYTPQTSNTIVRVTTRYGEDNTKDDVQTLAINCGSTRYDKYQALTFDLSTCKGMINWLGRVGVYGVEGAADTIFFSDIEDASYFPFPNNVLMFDTDVLAVHNYLDNLLVITLDAVWLVTPGTNIMTSTQKKILENTNITEVDALHVQVLKQEIFFKMGNQFYVLKPNKYTADATDLKNYLNSTAISNLTENFTKEITTLVNKMYRPDRLVADNQTENLILPNHKVQHVIKDFNVRHLHSVLKNSEVHYIYTLTFKWDPEIESEDQSNYVDLHIIYNTITRSWRLYIVGARATMTQTDHTPMYYINKQSNETYEFFGFNPIPQLVISKLTSEIVDDFLSVELDEDSGYPITSLEFNNYQYIDTGTIAVDAAFTKRYREVQFSLLNMEHTQIPFHMYFQLDGKEQVSATKYVVQHITDPNEADYGSVYITPIESNNMFLYGDTSLGISGKDDYWTLDNSIFPSLRVVNVRVELLGRGRRASLQLLNTSLKRYELAELTWVYRTMSAR